jgi:O-antigen/teichoic acid export membrane protein
MQSVGPYFGGSIYPHSAEAEKEALRGALVDLQRKNDMLTMFIVFLVVFVIMHYNTLNHGVPYYGGLQGAPFTSIPTQ